jgi:hypothetical protein
MTPHYLIIGNNTFTGFTVGEALVSHHRMVRHFYFPRQLKRCHANEYFEGQIPYWTHQCDSISGLARSIIGAVEENPCSYVLCSGEVESAILTQLRIRHYWIVDGADLSENPFKTSKEGLALRDTLSASQYLRKIITTQRDHRYACRLLGLSSRLCRQHLFPVRPVLISHTAEVLEKLKAGQSSNLSSMPVRPMIVSVARRVYSGGDTFSKGTEHIVDALRRMSNIDAHFIFSLAGPDAIRFRADIERIGLKSVSFSPHFTQTELHQILRANPYAIVLDQFGEAESVYSGMLRESMLFGLPVISDHFFGDNPHLDKPLGLFTAYSGYEIKEHLLYLISMAPEERMQLRRKILEQTLEIFNPEEWLRRLEDLILRDQDSQLAAETKNTAKN